MQNILIPLSNCAIHGKKKSTFIEDKELRILTVNLK